jgi:hypothetical protein
VVQSYVVLRNFTFSPAKLALVTGDKLDFDPANNNSLTFFRGGKLLKVSTVLPVGLKAMLRDKLIGPLVTDTVKATTVTETATTAEPVAPAPATEVPPATAVAPATTDAPTESTPATATTETEPTPATATTETETETDSTPATPATESTPAATTTETETTPATATETGTTPTPSTDAGEMAEAGSEVSQMIEDEVEKIEEALDAFAGKSKEDLLALAASLNIKQNPNIGIEKLKARIIAKQTELAAETETATPIITT